MLALGRMSWDERTREYVVRRTVEGKCKWEILRCLKRYVAHEIYRILTAPGVPYLFPYRCLDRHWSIRLVVSLFLQREGDSFIERHSSPLDKRLLPYRLSYRGTGSSPVRLA